MQQWCLVLQERGLHVQMHLVENDEFLGRELRVLRPSPYLLFVEL